MTAGSPLPTAIGPYRVLRPLARGGNAEVFVVEDPHSGEHLALKLLMQKGTARQRFDREWEAMIRLNHPNIVRVYSYGLHHDMPWMTMELLGGTPVQVYVRDTGKPGTDRRTAECARIGADLARALEHIHRRGLVHRDLKSANVLVLPDGRVKLLDFGTAKVAEALEQITRPNEFMGTFAYASPEQIQGRPVDARADLYSLGVLLYRLFSGVLPFQNEDPQQLARAQISQPARPIFELLPSIPEEIGAVIMQMLSKLPDMRPPTGTEVADRLEAGLGRPLSAPGILDVREDSVLGRDDALAELRALLDAPRPGGVALVVGQPGSGRDGVMRAVLADATARGNPSVEVRFGDNAQISAIAFLREQSARIATPSSMAAPYIAGVQALAPDAGGPRVRDLLRAAGAAILGELAREAAKPLLVAAHELHGAPIEASEYIAAWAAGCARQGAAVMFVGSASEAADDAQGSVRQALPGARRVVLAALDVPQTARVVGELLLRRPPPAAIARRIHAASDGQPEYVAEVVRGMVDDGLLKQQGRDANRIEWASQEGLAVPIAEAARSSVFEALAALPAERRRVLEALAIVGRDATAAEIAWYLERAPDEVAPALADPRLRELVAIEPDGDHLWLRWRQHLAESSILAQIHPCRADVIRRRIAAIVGDDTPITPAQIRTLVDLGDVASAVLRARIWADTALARNAPVTALEGIEPVIAVADRAEVPRDELAWLYLSYAKALLLARPTDPQTGKTLAKAATYGEGPRFQAELALLRARVQRVIGHYANYQKQLAEAWAHIGKIEGGFDPAVASLGATIAQETSEIYLLGGALDKATLWARESRTMALRASAPHEHALADAAQAGLLLVRGSTAKAEKALAKVLKFADQNADSDVLAAVLPTWSMALRQQGRWTEALVRLDASVPSYRSAESPTVYVRLLVAAAGVEVDLCRLGRAQELVDELFATLRRGEHLNLRLEADIVAGRIQLASGNVREAMTLFASVADRARTAGIVSLCEQARALHAEALWAYGDYDVAEKQFADAVAVLVPSGDVQSLVDVCLTRARAMSASVNPNELLKPIQPFVEAEPAYVARLEWLLATARFQRASGQDSKPTAERAAAILHKMLAKLDPTVQAALRVHPWSREIRAGGASL